MNKILIDRATVEQVLEALEAGPDVDPIFAGETEDALRAALAEPTTEDSSEVEPVEPVAWMTHGHDLLPLFHKTKAGALAWGSEPQPLYTTPPQRKPLTVEEIAELARQEQFLLICDGLEELTEITRSVERAHGIE